MRVNCGDNVKDDISGCEGIVTGITHYLNGCVSVLVEGGLSDDGKVITNWFDEQRLTVVLENAYRPHGSEVPSGGPVYRQGPTTPAT